MADEPEVDLKLLDQTIKKVLAFKPKKKAKPAARSSPAMRF